MLPTIHIFLHENNHHLSAIKLLLNQIYNMFILSKSMKHLCMTMHY
jgi:hypothetical protein